MLYPTFAKESLHEATTSAHATLIEECALRLRELALAPPYRTNSASRPDMQAFTKKRKVQDPWMPNLGEWYERRARTVGACLLVEGEVGARRGAAHGEVVLVAIDENGEMLDRLRCRWLLTSIRTKAGSGHTSAHDAEKKVKELARLEQWLHDVRCEAIAVGACSLKCRRIRDEVSGRVYFTQGDSADRSVPPWQLDHVAFAMALRASGTSSAEQMADTYYRTAAPFSDTPMCTQAHRIPFMRPCSSPVVQPCPFLCAVPQAARISVDRSHDF